MLTYHLFDIKLETDQDDGNPEFIGMLADQIKTAVILADGSLRIRLLNADEGDGKADALRRALRAAALTYSAANEIHAQVHTVRTVYSHSACHAEVRISVRNPR
jgi:hypothetical protein